MRKGIYILIRIFLIYWIATLFVPAIIEKGSNPVKNPPLYEVSKEALDLFNDLDFVADLHCDALLWGMDLSKSSDFGHVDFPRMQEGNIALQVFTIVSKSPKRQNMATNSANALDNITLLNIAQGRPLSNWFSLKNRTIYQSYKLRDYGNNFNDEFILIKSNADVLRLFEARKTNKKIIAGLLGIEGAHALKGDIQNLEEMNEAGVRSIGPMHFFDNEMGGSVHAISGDGLTDFVIQFIERMNELNMIIDLAHVSPKMFDDVLEYSEKPVMVSHTGIRSLINSLRNLSDEQIKKFAAIGGVIGQAFFVKVFGENEIKGILASMKKVKNLVGVGHIDLGSDYEGSVAKPFDISGFLISSEAIIQKGFSEDETISIMGENINSFFLESL